MKVSLGIVQIPASYETLRAAVGADKVSQLLIECPDDLSAIKKAVAEVKSSRQGKLLFLRGTPGAGKSTLAESVPVFLADVVGAIVTPPPEFQVSLTRLPKWISNNLPKARQSAGSRVVLVSLDRREIPVSDETATQAAMGNLNGLLRITPDLLLVWPVNSREFADAAIARLVQAGGQTALARDSVHELIGLPQERYYDALRLILDATSVRLEDAAISIAEAQELVSGSGTIGDYLRRVQALVVERYDLGELGTRLPRLNIVVTSNDDTYNACRLLRRGTRFFIDPDKLLQFSRSNVADDWRRRGHDYARRGLPFITSLFEVRLLNLSSSAVVNACAFGLDASLRKVVRKHYATPVKGNAGNAMRNSALARALRSEEDVGVARSQSTEAVRKAYSAIQKLTGTNHRQINEAIVRVLSEQLELVLPDLDFERHLFKDPKLELRCDVWFQPDNRPSVMEFTHRRDGDASTAVISSYALGKIQDYARDFGLI